MQGGVSVEVSVCARGVGVKVNVCGGERVCRGVWKRACVQLCMEVSMCGGGVEVSVCVQVYMEVNVCAEVCECGGECVCRGTWR